ncbi:MAG: 1-acyl-sn-glycerol-3-phosphate acyltransferase [Bacteroidales bacterium]|jgi:putative hemolysin
MQLIDVKSVLQSKNPSLAKVIPQFLVNYLRRIIHEDELNEFLKLYGNLENAELVGAGLKYLNINYSVAGAENLPTEGRYIFVSNHPLGGLDGLVFIYELSKYYPEIKFPVNDILLNIGNMNGIFLAVNKHGAQAKEAARLIEEAYASDSQILYFPAGLCSRKKRGIITDLRWQKSFITKAVAHKRDVIPAYFSGRNSDFFYNLSNIRNFLGIKANIEMLWLPDEMFRQKDKNINLAFGKSIPWQTFDRSKSPSEWSEWVRSVAYHLAAEIKQQAD